MWMGESFLFTLCLSWFLILMHSFSASFERRVAWIKMESFFALTSVSLNGLLNRPILQSMVKDSQASLRLYQMKSSIALSFCRILWTLPSLLVLSLSLFLSLSLSFRLSLHLILFLSNSLTYAYWFRLFSCFLSLDSFSLITLDLLFFPSFSLSTSKLTHTFSLKIKHLQLHLMQVLCSISILIFFTIWKF